MFQIKRNFIYALEKRKKNGSLIIKNVPIRLRVNYNGGRVDISTGYRIDSDKWDSSNKKVISGATNKYEQTSIQINEGLAEIKKSINTIFIEGDKKRRIPSKQEILNAVRKNSIKYISEKV